MLSFSVRAVLFFPIFVALSFGSLAGSPALVDVLSNKRDVHCNFQGVIITPLVGLI